MGKAVGVDATFLHYNHIYPQPHLRSALHICRLGEAMACTIEYKVLQLVHVVIFLCLGYRLNLGLVVTVFTQSIATKQLASVSYLLKDQWIV